MRVIGPPGIVPTDKHPRTGMVRAMAGRPLFPAIHLSTGTLAKISLFLSKAPSSSIFVADFSQGSKECHHARTRPNEMSNPARTRSPLRWHQIVLIMTSWAIW